MCKAIVFLFAAAVSVFAALPASAQPPAASRSQATGPSATALAARPAVIAVAARGPAQSSPNSSASFSHLDVASRPLLELPFATRQAAAGEPLPALSASDCTIR
jgi:hypothetical protein